MRLTATRTAFALAFATAVTALGDEPKYLLERVDDVAG